MEVCVKIPGTGHKVSVFCRKEVKDSDYVPMSIQSAVVECIRPDEFRDVCPACRKALIKHISL